MWIFACEHPFIALLMFVIVFFIFDSALACIQNCVMFICRRTTPKREDILSKTVSHGKTKIQEVKNNEKDQ